MLSVGYRGAQPGSLAMRGGWVGGGSHWQDGCPLGVRADDVAYVCCVFILKQNHKIVNNNRLQANMIKNSIDNDHKRW